MSAKATVETINRELKIYGNNEYNKPIYRVVLSDEQVEKRRGSFNEFHGQIFIRTVHGVKEVKKYPWIKGKWILEKWASGALGRHRDLVSDENGVYVCVYVFQDANCNYLPPLWKVCQIVINNLNNPRTAGQAMAEDRAIEDRKEKEEIDVIENELKIGSDEAATKDPKSSRETASVGYVKEKI